MKPTRGVLLWSILMLALAAFFMAGCAATEPAPPKPKSFACADKGNLVRSLVPEAKLTGFDCHFADYKNVKSLYFNVSLKNVGSEPQRFRVNIFLENGKAVGGLVPRKGKPPVLKPGQEVTVKYPVKGMDQKPKSVTLMVKTASY